MGNRKKGVALGLDQLMQDRFRCAVLDACEWNRSRAARELGITARSLRQWIDRMRRLGYEFPFGISHPERKIFVVDFGKIIRELCLEDPLEKYKSEFFSSSRSYEPRALYDVGL